jgi:hypothetical protein
MNNWIGRLALVIGATSGIGRSIATALVENGMIMIRAIYKMLKKNVLYQCFRSTFVHTKSNFIDVREKH